MTFAEANTVEAHLRDLLAGAASARPAQLTPCFARSGGKTAGVGWHCVVFDGCVRGCSARSLPARFWVCG